MTIPRPDWRWSLVILLGWVYALSPGRIDGLLFPVVEPMQLVKLEPADFDLGTGKLPGVLVWGASIKSSRDCSYRELDWHMGTRLGKDTPVEVITGVPVVRGEGPFNFGPWKVAVRWQDFFTTYADVKHQCRVFGMPLPWVTRTKFWR